MLGLRQARSHVDLRVLPARTTLNQTWPPNTPRKIPQNRLTPHVPVTASPTPTRLVSPHDQLRVAHVAMSTLDLLSHAKVSASSAVRSARLYPALWSSAALAESGSRLRTRSALSARYSSLSQGGYLSPPPSTHARLSVSPRLGALAFFRPPTCLVFCRRGGMRRRWLQARCDPDGKMLHWLDQILEFDGLDS